MLLTCSLVWVVIWSLEVLGGGKELHVLWGGGMAFIFQSSAVFWHVKIYLYELSDALKIYS